MNKANALKLFLIVRGNWGHKFADELAARTLWIELFADDRIDLDLARSVLMDRYLDKPQPPAAGELWGACVREVLRLGELKRRSQKALPEPRRSPAEVARAKAKLKEIVEGLGTRFAMPAGARRSTNIKRS